jgi:hypothetical protein
MFEIVTRPTTEGSLWVVSPSIQSFFFLSSFLISQNVGVLEFLHLLSPYIFLLFNQGKDCTPVLSRISGFTVFPRGSCYPHWIVLSLPQIPECTRTSFDRFAHSSDVPFGQRLFMNIDTISHVHFDHTALSCCLFRGVLLCRDILTTAKTAKNRRMATAQQLLLLALDPLLLFACAMIWITRYRITRIRPLHDANGLWAEQTGREHWIGPVEAFDPNGGLVIRMRTHRYVARETLGIFIGQFQISPLFFCL